MEEPKDFILETNGCGLRFIVEYTTEGLCNIIDEDSDTILILNCDTLKDGIRSSDIAKIDVIKKANAIWDKLYNNDDGYWTTGDFISWGETMAFINKKGQLTMYLIPLFDGKHDEDFDEFVEFVINCPIKHNLPITDCYKMIPVRDLEKCHLAAEEKRDDLIRNFENLKEDPDNGFSIYLN